METIKIKRLQYEDGAWYWTVSNPFTEEDTRYWTDHYGEGIFNQSGQQVGTCQFSLARYSISGARKKINRFFAE